MTIWYSFRTEKLITSIMTAYGTTETAIEATKMGAFDYILKPFDIPEMLKIITQAIDVGRFMRLPVEMDIDLPANTMDREVIIGRSKLMQEVFKAIGRVAATDATVLIHGETGTGKELAARAVYQHSLRSEQPFLVINCVALPESLLESELFGFEKGAFTGATHRRIGKIEQACGGTVFLDEIGDMPLKLQTKILRLLQEKKIERLGGREAIPVDVRIIAATNRNLEESISTGLFREDLYYRLKVVTILLPPLKERCGDIPLLIQYFMTRYSAELGIDNPGINAEAISLLNHNPWSGNVRELANTLKKALIFNRGTPLDTHDVAGAIGTDDPKDSKHDQMEAEIRKWFSMALRNSTQKRLFDTGMDRFAAILIQEALKFTGGNRSLAAKHLGLSRPTLHSKIDKYHIELETSVKGGNV